jgi:hypothetical protein
MTPPASRHREPHQAADLRGEGMTGSPFEDCGRRDTGIDESNAPHPPNRERPQTTFLLRCPCCAERRRRQGPPAACAVGLRPSPDPDASIRRARHLRRKDQKDQPYPLTGPVPSGMTCDNNRPMTVSDAPTRVHTEEVSRPGSERAEPPGADRQFRDRDVGVVAETTAVGGLETGSAGGQSVIKSAANRGW